MSSLDFNLLAVSIPIQKGGVSGGLSGNGFFWTLLTLTFLYLVSGRKTLQTLLVTADRGSIQRKLWLLVGLLNWLLPPFTFHGQLR